MSPAGVSWKLKDSREEWFTKIYQGIKIARLDTFYLTLRSENSFSKRALTCSFGSTCS